MSEVHLKINDQPVVAESGQTVLEAALAAGVDIPVLCYHPAVSTWGACRMCLVEVEGMRGLQTACTLPVSDDMEVQTETEEVVEARKFVLELLFSERNHYCMYCQMSGDCELQSLAYRYGLDHWTYPRPYEKMEIDASRKYFIMDHNRCILCTRCVRACAEIPANHTLGVRERGADSMIMADLDVPFGDSSCIECGTCLQVCPTGALVDARSAYGGRETDVTHTQTTCMQCSVGCVLDVVTRYSRLLRVDGVWDAEPSDGLLCVDGRFKPLYDDRRRVKTPLVRKDGELVEADWDEAMQVVADKLKDNKTLGLATCATTNEALEAFAGLFDNAGRVEPTAPELDYGEPAQVKDLLGADFIVVAGADPLNYQKVIGYLIRRVAEQGTPVALIDEEDNELSEHAVMNVSADEAEKVVAEAAEAEKPVVVYSLGLTTETAEALEALADKALFLGLDPARNGAGALKAGLTSVNGAQADVVYMLVGEQPVSEDLTAHADGAFTVVQASYHSPLTEAADIVLPAPIWVERTGHFTNVEGKVLPLTPALEMPEGVRDDAEVLKTLAGMV